MPSVPSTSSSSLRSESSSNSSTINYQKSNRNYDGILKGGQTKKNNSSDNIFSPEQQQHLAPFTIKQLRDAVPAECFERSLIKSFSYLVLDIVVVACLFWIASAFNDYIGQQESSVMSYLVAISFWNIYWFTQGAFMTGIWVIAHECGHQSFSDWKVINNSLGWVLHSSLLVPYHSWRITHGIHHKSTSHMERDQVYVPKTKSQVTREVGDIHNAIADSPIVSLVQIIIMLVLGWPFYLATNAWGQNYGKRTNHFEPRSPMFKPTHKFDVLLSDLGLILMMGVISWYCFNYSFISMVKFYGVPYLWVNFWLVLITYLQHTDLRVPHYRGEEWNFIRGALCTVDRNYGIFNSIHHHIGDTHVAHHLFSTMPHYNAQKATYYLKKALGKYYLEDETPILNALWKSWNTCHYVADDGDILYYNTFNSPTKKIS